MGKYNYLGEVNENKIFIVKRALLENRIEPEYYKSEYTSLDDKIKSQEYFKLKELTEPFKNGSTPTGGNFEDIGVLYYRSQNFDLFDLKKDTFITKEFNEKITRSFSEKDDILLAVVGATLGKIGFLKTIEDEGNINQNVARIRLKSELFLPEFIAIYLWSSIGQKYIFRNATITTQAYLNNQQLGNIPVPFLGIDIQKKIISLINQAYIEKKQKEQNIKDLLKSIDDYILDELDINLVEEDTSLQSRIFKVNYSAISGLRIDPEMTLYSQKISESKYPLVPLGSLLKIKPQYGANEAGIERLDKKSARYIRITDIDSNGFLKPGLGKTTETIEEQYFLNDKDILFARSGNTVGKTYIHLKNKVNYQCFFAGYMIRFIVNENKLLPDFLFAYTQTKPYREWVKAIQRTAGQPNINAEEYKSLNIPLPAIKKQKEITSHISELRARVRVLQQETENDFITVKQEVELLILDNK